VISGVHCMDEVTLSDPVSTWMGDCLRVGIPSRYITSQLVPCIPLGSLSRVPAMTGVRAGMSPLPGGR